MATATFTTQTQPDLETLDEIQRRVLWLATNMIHHANHIRPNPDHSKVGGHQASCASMVTIMTALYFHYLNSNDRISVKPHASPVLHAIQYLLDQLPRDYLPKLRAYGGLQAYPSRTKDPDNIDFSTGSVGLGAVAPAFAALASSYTAAHFNNQPDRRFVAVIGDAELDEGNVWEAMLDEPLRDMGNLLWVVDLNRQSLDRVIPGIKAIRLKKLFNNLGWQVLEAKYGRRLQALYDAPDGDLLEKRIDEMSNIAYQNLLRMPPDKLRPKLTQGDPKLEALMRRIPDDELASVLGDLGGHDIGELITQLEAADADQTRPTVLFAYTIKGWGLPIAGHPLNHSMLLNQAQIDEFRLVSGIGDDEWAAFDRQSMAGKLCAVRSNRLYPADKAPSALSLTPDMVPASVQMPTNGMASTQQSFGRILMSLSREKDLAKHIVTASPDVSSSTNLSGWVGKMGVFAPKAQPDYAPDSQHNTLWKYSPSGQHIELGISEMNLFMLLSSFGLSAELLDQPLIPIGTVYDPFVCRGLDAMIYALYSGAKFIIAGTPSGVTLSPEGGAHQSTVTSSLGIELPNMNYYEPCFAQEVAWLMLDGMRHCADRINGRASYLRLSTKPIDQAPFAAALRRLGEDRLREQVLAGGYRLIDWKSAENVQREYLVHIATTGAMIPEAVAAAAELAEEGIPANVINLTSPRRLYEAWQRFGWDNSPSLFTHPQQPFDWLIPPNERHAPIITINDGASHAHAWLGSVFGSPVIPLGVDSFGQSGTRADLYNHFGIDAHGIVNASLAALNRMGLA